MIDVEKVSWRSWARARLVEFKPSVGKPWLGYWDVNPVSGVLLQQRIN